MMTSIRRLALALLVLTLAVGACSSDDDGGDAADGADTTEPSDGSGATTTSADRVAAATPVAAATAKSRTTSRHRRDIAGSVSAGSTDARAGVFHGAVRSLAFPDR